MDDLVQEVFLVLHAKRDLLADIKPLDPWLREVCRRVAAGERRRAHRRREVVSGQAPEPTDDGLLSDGAVEIGQRAERLHHALAQLDERSRDLVALHELGDLPLENVAELVDADRKTVRKRLSVALKRLTWLLGAAPRATTTLGSDDSSEPPRSTGELQVLARHPAVTIGLVESVVIAIWPSVATVEALEVLDEAFAAVLEQFHGGGFAYLAVVDAVTRPPDLAARQKIVAMLEKYRRNISVYATAIEGDSAWIVRPVMTGLSFLARPPFPMQYFNGVPLAARWLAEKHARLSNVTAASLVETTERLRSYAWKQGSGEHDNT